MSADSFHLIPKSLNFLKKRSYAIYQIKIEALYKKLFQLNNRNFAFIVGKMGK